MVAAWHRFYIAHRMVRARGYAAEQCEELREAWQELQATKAETERGKALQSAAFALWSGGLPANADILPTFDAALADFIAADQQYRERPEDDERPDPFQRRSNALTTLLTTSPQTTGQAREVLRASIGEMVECSLMTGGPLCDSIELALRGVLRLFDRLEPNGGRS
jgi:hypothetical protein